MKRTFLALIALMLLPGLAAAQDTVNYAVSLDFVDDNDTVVTVALTCNNGLPLSQSAQLGDGDSVTFVVTEVTSADCEVSFPEIDNYSSDGDGCSATLGGEVLSAECAITYSPDAASIEVNAIWDNDDADIEEGWSVELTCTGASDLETNGPDAECDDGTCVVLWEATGSVSGAMNYVTVADADTPAACSAVIMADDSAVEWSVSCSGDDLGALEAGDSVECDITFTAFFEGIPTLSQYGMAIMVLLMLGVGFVGFRRLV